MGIVHGKHDARTGFLQSFEVEESVRGGIEYEDRSLAPCHTCLEVGRQVKDACHVALLHPLAGFEDVGCLAVDGGLGSGVEQPDVFTAEGGVGEVYHCDGSLAHQVGGVHVVVEQSVEEDTACQHEQDGGIGGDGMPLVSDDGSC